jgi:hypothetical protein
MSRFAKFIGIAAAAIGVGGFVVAAINLIFGVSILDNPSERYRAELEAVAQPLVEVSYSLLAKPGVTEELKKIADTSKRLEAMEAIFTKYVNDNQLEGKLEQVVDIYDRIAACQRSWFCHFDDYEALNDQMINVWFSYAGKIRQMRTDGVAGSDFGVPLEREARRLRAEQKAKVG